MAHRNKSTAKNLDAQSGRIEGERLKPIRKVMREIEGPDGTILRVKVPVYPPFKLKAQRKTKDWARRAGPCAAISGPGWLDLAAC